MVLWKSVHACVARSIVLTNIQLWENMTRLSLSLCLLLSAVAFGQEWQSYQLTDYPPPGQVRQCGSVMDTLGHVHHYFLALRGDDIYDMRTYYMRTDIYGQVLTDTVRLDAFADPMCMPFFTSVVGDGADSWCVFSQWRGPEWRRGLYLSGHGPTGNTIMPTTLLGYPGGGEGPPSLNLSAVYRPSDNTIHLVGNANGKRHRRRFWPE